jgi:hypothetical protein
MRTFLAMLPEYLNIGTCLGQGMDTSPTKAPLPQVICSMGYLLPAMRQLNDKSKTKNKPNAPSLMNEGRGRS